MSLDRGRMYGAEPAPAPAGTLAGAHAAGRDGFSGMVPAGSPITTDPDAGGRRDDLGRHPVQTSPQHGSDLAPIPGVVTRTMFGGVRNAPHAGLMADAPAFDGGHVELRNRRSVVVLAASEQMLPEAGPQLPSLRTPPVSDPYGRACANAEAARR